MFSRQKSADPIPFRLAIVLIVFVTGSMAATGCSSPEATKRRYVVSGDKYVSQGRYEEGIVQYRNAVQIDSRFAEARLKLARAYEHSGNDTSALREYVRAADLLPGDDEAQLAAAQHLLRARRFDDARRRAELVLARSPHNVTARVSLGNSLAGLKDLETVVHEMTVAFMQGFPLALSDAAADVRRRADSRGIDAERVFRQAVDGDPTSLLARLSLANFYLASGRGGDAERTLNEALALDPHDVLTKRSLAIFYIASNRWANAEAPLMAIATAAQGGRDALLLADYYARGDREADARHVLEPLALAAEMSVEANVRLAEMDARAGDMKAALVRIAKALGRDSKNGRALTLRGQLRLGDGHAKDAIRDLQSAVAALPTSPTARMLLAQAFERNGSPDFAIEAYEELLKIDAASPVGNRQLARLQLAAGRTAAAVDHAGRALSASPSDPGARLLLARALAANRELDRAVAELGTIIKEDPQNADGQATLGTVMVASRKWADARRLYSAALAVDRTHPEATLGLVNIDVETRRYDDARERLDAWMRTARHDAALDVVAATAYARIGAPREAETLLLKTIQADPSRLAAYNLLGRVYLSEKRLDEARQQFEIVLTKAPASVSAATMLGMILEAQHKLGEAQATYKRALDVDPEAPVAANNLAWIYANGSGNLDLALQLAQTATRRLPAAPEVSDTLGWIYYRKNMTEQAIPAFEQSVARQPESAEFRFHLGLAYLRAGRPQPGKSALARALQLDPNFAGADEARRLVGQLP